eukprot:5595996-Amphidinium_carterae.1
MFCTTACDGCCLAVDDSFMRQNPIDRACPSHVTWACVMVGRMLEHLGTSKRSNESCSLNPL